MDHDPTPLRPNPKPKSRRSLGPVLLVSALLLLLLVVFGPQAPQRHLSEDEFWALLYTGQVESPKVSGNRISGTIPADATPDSKTATGDTRIGFVVTVPDGAAASERIRRIHAKELGPPIPEAIFLRKLKEGSIHPLRGYPLSIRELSTPGDPKSAPRMVQRFFADFADAEGMHYAEIVGNEADHTDLAVLATAFQEEGAELEQGLYFDEVTGLTTEEQNNFLLYFLTTFGPLLILVLLFWFLFMRQMRGQGQGLMSFGRSRAVVYNKESDTKVTFKDVAGIDEAKEEVDEIIQFLRSPAKFKRLGGRIPRGVLLVGPPGTGKTLLAKAIAGEAEVPFFSISGSDFVEMFVGVGASRVRDLFKQARESAPCIVFLDEIDAVGRKRGTGMGGGHDEREQTLNAILVEMDGFGTDEGIILMAATNRPDVLDPALLRPGRFDREIVIDLPDVRGREAILRVHSKEVTMSPEIDLRAVALGTPGFSGAELAALVNEAAIGAAIKNREQVTQADFDEARDKIAFGREKKSRVMDPEDKRITAFHEAGHALVSSLLENTEPVHKVTIIPRGMALGATMMLPERDRMHMSRRRLLDELAVLFGGRVAEEVFCNDITSGASNDIQRATHIAKLMVTEWGMSDRLGPIHLADRYGSEFLGTELTVGRDHSEATIREIDEELHRILHQAYERAQETILSNRESLERLAEALLRFETLQGSEVRRLVAGETADQIRPGSPANSTPPPVPDQTPDAEIASPEATPQVEESGEGMVPPQGEGLSPA